MGGHRGNPDTLRAVGRDDELAAVATGLANTGARAVVIDGPAGMGKSTVWRAAVNDAGASGSQVLAVRPREVEASMPFAALQGLLGDCVDALANALPLPQRAALDVVLLRAAPGAHPVENGVVAAATLSAIRALGAKNPLLIAIDDAQWLDPASPEALAFAARRLSSGDQVRLLVTWRAAVSEPDLGLDADDLCRISVGPLSPEALREVVRRRLGQVLGMTAARALHEVSGGNPFYALELARSHPDGEFGIGRALTLDDVRTLLGRRFAELPAATVRALATVAAMTAPDVERIREVIADEAILDTAFALDILTEREPGRVEFTHPLLAAAAYAAVSPRQRRAIHAGLADSAATVEERARHLAVASTAPDPAIAAVIDVGAAQAAARAAPADAARLSEIAARLTPPGDHEAAARRRLAAASWHFAAGDLAAAVDVWTDVATACPPGDIHAEALAQLANSAPIDYERAVAMAEQAVAESSTVRSRVRHIALRANVLAQSDNQRALAMLRAAAAEARAAGDDVALAAVLPELGFQASLSTPELDGVPLLREAVALEGQIGGAVDAYMSPENRLGIVLVQRNELTEARTLLRRHMDACIARGDERGSCGVAMHLCEAELRAGDLDRAQTTINWALTVADSSETSQNVGMYLAFAGLIAAHRGEVETARTLTGRLAQTVEVIGEPHNALAQRIVAGYLELSLGNHAVALDWLEPTVEMFRSIGYVEPGAYFFLPDRLEALIAVGRHTDAERDIAEWETIGRRYDRPFALATAARAHGMLLAAQSHLREADIAFTDALEHHQRLDWPHQHARTLLAHGKALRRTGRRRDARSRLQAALDVFESIGEPLWASRARDEMARLGGRTPAGERLTDGERRVVELVAAGRSNREVAAELSITVKTVEAVLTRAYAKLNVRSRAELAANWPTRTAESPDAPIPHPPADRLRLRER